MVRAVGRRHIAHDIGDRAQPVKIVGADFGLLRVVLQDDHDLALFAHCLLGRGDRGGPADGEWKHHFREQHEIARRQHDQGVRR